MANNKVQLKDGTTLMDVSGVTVTPETLASGMTAMDMTGAIITGTMSGGGLPSGFSAIARGTHTISSAVRGGTSFNVTHNLGFVPDMFLFYATSNPNTAYSMGYAFRGDWTYRGSTYVGLCGYIGSKTSTYSYAGVTSSYGIKTLTSTTATITTYSSSTSYYWRAGTYKWIAIKF